MKIAFNPPKTVVLMTSKPEAGCYALEDADDLKWVKCREQFASYFHDKTDGFYFSHNPNEGENVASFIARTEEILDGDTQANLFPALPISSYSKTNRNFMLWVCPSSFWKCCPMRRSLFTILLRCGLTYIPAKDNYEESLYSYKYIVNTSDAMKRFLFGFTKITKPELFATKGWATIFDGKPKEEIRKLLVAPQPQEGCVVGMNSLWA